LTATQSHEAELFIGLMSGTSLDGIDAVLARFPASGAPPEQIAVFYTPYPKELKARLLTLHATHPDDLHLAHVMGLELADRYAQAVHHLLDQANMSARNIRAIGCHGQTIRHRPDAGYSVQLVSGSQLAEQTGITSIIDFRSRDIAAGGQGAPLVPAYHAATLSSSNDHRVIVNIGGIANLTDLPLNGTVTGFDCGPGNLLMDAWAAKHLDKPIDENGAWAASGRILPKLLSALLADGFFASRPPKSAGREQFNLDWLNRSLSGKEATADVQATLLELTARGIVDAANKHCKGFDALYVCGGGVHNPTLMNRLSSLAGKPVQSTAALGMDPDWLEALAFAWLARQCIHGKSGNLPAVTGAAGPRILGAIYPA
jgi:anhydro-N-acetylmuramic acid kinase